MLSFVVTSQNLFILNLLSFLVVKTKVYYDGSCRLCSAAITKYTRKQNFQSIDISKSTFNANKEGLKQTALMKKIHLRLPSGKIVTGVEALIVLWKNTPGYAGLGLIISLPVIKQLAQAGYWAVARMRHF